jgi:hypothetical protein
VAGVDVGGRMKSSESINVNPSHQAALLSLPQHAAITQRMLYPTGPPTHDWCCAVPGRHGERSRPVAEPGDEGY